MRLTCPNCQQSVTVADTEGGKPVTCSHCAYSFAAPQMYALEPFELSVTPASPPQAINDTVPTMVSPLPPASSPTDAPLPELPPAMPVAPEGYKHIASVPLTHQLCQWLVPICFTLIFLLGFFNWVGFYPAGYAAYAQNGWQALFGVMSADPVSEKLMKEEADINKGLRASMWLLPYFICMLLGLLLAWYEPIVQRLKPKLPSIFENVAHYRPALLALAAGVSLICVFMHYVGGYGLERAIASKIEESFKEEREKAKTPEEIQNVEMKIAMVKGSFHPRSTMWLQFMMFCHVLALIGTVGETLLIHRGSKPPPRIGVMW